MYFLSIRIVTIFLFRWAEEGTSFSIWGKNRKYEVKIKWKIGETFKGFILKKSCGEIPPPVSET